MNARYTQTRLSLPILDAPLTSSNAVSNVDLLDNRPLTDQHQRKIGYLRLSLTEACAMRCVYCRPETNKNPRHEKRMSVTQIKQLVTFLASNHQVSKIRLTGGDPTSHPEHLQIIQTLSTIPGIEDLAMTTNGLTLPRMAQAYYEAGLHRINISLDTLNSERFHTMTGVNGLSRVLKGIDTVLSLPFQQVKLNAVVVRDQNENDLPDLLLFAAKKQIRLRMIELMPMGPLADRWHERYVPEARMREILAPHIQHWRPLDQQHDAARSYDVILNSGQKATIGFITPMSCNFCANCNRIRITSQGQLYPCLMNEPSGSILSAWQPTSQSWNHQLLQAILHHGLSIKNDEHPHDGHGVMTQIGG